MGESERRWEKRDREMGENDLLHTPTSIYTSIHIHHPPHHFTTNSITLAPNHLNIIIPHFFLNNQALIKH